MIMKVEITKMKIITDHNHHLAQQLIIEQWSKGQNLPDLSVPDFTDFLIEEELITEPVQLDLLYLCWLDMIQSDKTSP